MTGGDAEEVDPSSIPRMGMDLEWFRVPRPTLIEHYWFEPDAQLEPVARHVACVDYSVANHEPLVAYRFDGESELSAEKFTAAWPQSLSLVIAVPHSNIAWMNQWRESGIVICSLYHLSEVIEQADAVISVLGNSDKLLFPDVGGRVVLRLALDDLSCSSENLFAPNRKQIADLIEFARRWNGAGTLLVHCRAGSSRSPAAAMIASAALGRPDSAALALRVRTAKAYFRPNEAMLKLADGLLGPVPGLVDLARSVPVPTRTDPWGPVRIPLTALSAP